MGKYSLIVVAGFAFTYGIINGNLNRGNERFVDNIGSDYNRAVAELAARSMVNLSLGKLRDSTSWRSGYSNHPAGGGLGWSTLVDSTTDTTLSTGQVRITAGGSNGEAADTLIVLAALPGPAGIPPGVHGAITANSTVTTLGNITIDGRDHDMNGTLIPGQGSKGISTTQTYNRGGNSKAGGTSSGTDYAPSKPADPAIIEENAAYAFPSSPDAVFGYSEGALKAMAQSGANGGQYVTNPSNLTFPLSGVTYVELSSGGTWQSIALGSSTGVLVVHNSAGDARIKNINSGTFKGLIIADDIDKIHTTIIGATISLTTSPGGNCIGNGSGEVLYSSEALQQSSSTAAGGGGGSGSITVLSWW